MARNGDRLPSQAQRKALLNIAAGREGGHGLSGMSAHGGFRGTIVALRRRGWVDAADQLTDLGQKVIERLKGSGASAHAA